MSSEKKLAQAKKIHQKLSSEKMDRTQLLNLVTRLDNKEGLLDADSFLTAVVNQFGGAEMMASAIYKEFRNAPEGSVVRQRIVGMITELIHKQTERRSKSEKSIENMTDEEIALSIETAVARMKGLFDEVVE